MLSYLYTSLAPLNRAICLAVLLGSMPVGVLATERIADDSWLSLRGGPSNRALGAGSTVSGKQRWAFDVGEGVCSTPTVAHDGTLYLAVRNSAKEQVIALDAAKGKVKWIREVKPSSSGGLEPAMIVPSSPAIGTAGLVYIRMNGTELHALRETDGESSWVFRTKGSIESSPNISAKGVVYFGTSDGSFYAVDESTGKLRWTRKMSGGLPGTPAIGVENRVYLGTTEGLVALDADTGENVWMLPVKDVGLYTAAIGPEGTVYIGATSYCRGDTMFAADGKTGKLKWKFYAGRMTMPYAAVGADGTVYIASRDNDEDWSEIFESLYALDGSTGRMIWHRKFDSLTIGSPPVVDSEGRVILVLSGKLTALDGKTGRTKWSADLNAGSFVPPAAIGADGTAYACTGNGKVLAFR